MKISRVDAFAIRMEKSTHGNVRGGTQPEVDDLGDHVIAKMAWTAIYSQHFETTIVTGLSAEAQRAKESH